MSVVTKLQSLLFTSANNEPPGKILMWRSLSTLHALLHMWVEKLQRVKYTSERNWLFDSCSHVIGMIIQLWRWKDSEITSCCQSTYSGNPFYKVPGRGSQPPRDRSLILSETAWSLTPTDLNDILGQPSEIPGNTQSPYHIPRYFTSPGISRPQVFCFHRLKSIKLLWWCGTLSSWYNCVILFLLKLNYD